MSKKFKLISFYLIEFILTILILLISLLIVGKMTFLNEEYVLKQLEKNNYYHNLYQDIEEEMGNYVDQSGLDETVIQSVTNELDIKKEVENFIKNLYLGKKTNIEVATITENVKNNIDDYLKQHNLVVDEDGLDLFIKEMENVYVNKITFNNKINSLGPILVKINNLSKISMIVLAIGIVSFFVIGKVFCRKYLLSIPCLSSALLIFLGNYLLFKNISIDYIKIWNDNVSSFIKLIIRDISNKTIWLSTFLILVFIGGVILKVAFKKSKTLKEKKNI